MSLKARYNSVTKSDKGKRRQQYSFNQGIRSTSIIGKPGQISTVSSEVQKNTEIGLISELFKGENFEVISEVMVQESNTGKRVASGDMFGLVQEGSILLEKDSNVATVRKGGFFSVEKGSEYSISVIGEATVNLIRMQIPNFDKSSQQITAPNTPDSQVLERDRTLAGIKLENVSIQDKRARLEHSKMIAKMASEDKGRVVRRRSEIIPVNAAGVPIR